MRHIIVTKEIAEEIQQLILSGKNVNNAKIRKYLENRNSNKEE